MSERVPILLFSDTPSAPSGLARICRDLATRISTNLPDVYEVATIGYGGPTSRSLPYHQYSWTFNDEWIIRDLPDVWRDFAGDRKGIMLTIQDPSRVTWLARPETCEDPRIRQYLQTRPFKLWGYFPIDATGPRGKLSVMLRECLMGYDRILCYSQWAENIVLNTIGIAASEERDLQNIPHGINTTVFNPRGRKWRQMFAYMVVGRGSAIADDETLIGIVATNQPRKDYGLMFEALEELSKTRKLRLWIHTDALDRTWSIPFLLSDFGLTKAEHMISLATFPDDTMAKLYSACDITLAPGCSEGFGYPIFESLACGTPCIHGNNGGAAEHMPASMLVEPLGYRVEGLFNSVRPVFRSGDWVTAVNHHLDNRQTATLPEHLAWDALWPRWERWLRKGVKGSRLEGPQGGERELVSPQT